MVMKPATMHETPAASPSSPSSQLTVFIMPVNQKMVSRPTTGQGKMICPSASGLLTRSMKMVNAMAIRLERNCPAYCDWLSSSSRSSTRPNRKMTVVPTSSPVRRVSSPGSWLGGNSVRGSVSVARTASVNPAYIATPPVRGTMPRCLRLPPGRSCTSRECPTRRASGVMTNATANAMAKTRR